MTAPEWDPPTKPSAIVFGRGLVGREMARALADRYDVRTVPREMCDVTHWSQVLRYWDTLYSRYSRDSTWPPDVVVNATGYTDVDKAEDEPELAYRVNGLGAENLARFAVGRFAVLVHISSDAVFGRYAQSYDELDQPSPISVYARTKLAGEALVERVSASSPLIIRTGNLYGAYGKNHASALARPLTERTRADADRAVAPTPGWLVAETVLKLLQAREHGIYHVMTTGRTSWHDFAIAAQQRTGTHALVEKRTGKYGRAPRPPYGLLHSVLLPLREIQMPSWKDALCEHAGREASR